MARTAPSGSPGVGGGDEPRTRRAVARAECQEFIHQLAVDAYGAQHASASGPTIGAAFALIGLYYTYEHGYSGRQVQHMHMLLARRTKSWPRFTAPAHAGSVTILDAMQAQPGEERDAMLRRWGQSVWDAWGSEHERVKALVERVMADD